VVQNPEHDLEAPEHDLEAPERHAERTGVDVLPVTDARYAARLRAHMDVVLQEVGVIGHWQRPIVVEMRLSSVERKRIGGPCWSWSCESSDEYLLNSNDRLGHCIWLGVLFHAEAKNLCGQSQLRGFLDVRGGGVGGDVPGKV